MNRLAEIKHKFGGNLVDEIVKTKSTIKSHWPDDKGKQVARNIEKIQKQFDTFYIETAKLIEKLEEVEKLGIKLTGRDKVISNHWWGENSFNDSNSDYSTLINDDTDLAIGSNSASNIGSGNSNLVSNNLEGSNYGTNEIIDFSTNSTEITTRYFNKEVLDNWKNIDEKSRENHLLNFAAEISSKSQLGVKGVKFDDKMPSNLRGGFNPETGLIEINSDILSDPDNLEDGINTILHESRHCFQKEAVANPSKYGVSEETAKIWEHNMKRENYIDPNLDFLAYEAQPIEADARNFAESIINNL